MKVFLDVVGCRLNQSEVERIATVFKALGHEIVPDPASADLAIVNTCAVTVKAAADSRKQLRRAGREGAKQVIATGCWATLYPEEAGALDGVTGVITNEVKDHLVAEVLDLSPEVDESLTLIREPLPGDHGRTRAFIKVQEGCDHHCTYCLTRLARGKSRSRLWPEVERDIQAALAGGAREIVLTGVQLGGWGHDFSEPQKLQFLVESALRNGDLRRLRLSSIEPWDIDPLMLELWRDARLCRHLHIPFQSGDDRVLRAMGRPITVKAYVHLIESIKKAIPKIAITTDMIVGFPGETEEAFSNTLNVIQELEFAGGHVFTYSPRPGTAAYKMKGQVPRKVAKERNAALRKVFQDSGKAYRERFIGRMCQVLWESSEQMSEGVWQLSGLTDTYIRIYVQEVSDLWNQITPVMLTGHHQRGNALDGKLLNSGDTSFK